MAEILQHQELSIPLGQIRGCLRKTIYDDTYYSFEGIPYAEPPIGDLRFKSPIPAKPWTDVKDCVEFNIKPVQKDILTGEIEGSEDCLYLNVFAKTLSSENPLPIMVFIFGDEYKNGDATRNTLSPDYLMMRDVILITFNYRMGALGFLSLQDPSVDIPGNAGLKDQLLALQWIKENCKYFNGDSDNITLFGQGTGSVCTHYMMNTPKAKDLFHKAILMSGTIRHTWSLMPCQDYAHRLAKALGFEGDNNDNDIKEFLLQQSANDLINCDVRTEEEKLQDLSFGFGPVIEPYETEHSVIVSEPKESIKKSWSTNIPLMLGGTSFEALIKYRSITPSHLEYIKDHPEYSFPMDLKEKLDFEMQRECGEDQLKEHMGNLDMSWENVEKYLKYMNIIKYWLGTSVTVVQRMNTPNTAPTYLYRFDFDSPTFNQNRIKYCDPDVRGVAHGDELSYLFYNRDACKLPLDSEEFKTIKLMVNIWYSFAKTSNPNCKEIEPIGIWNKLELENWTVINITNETKVLNDLPESEDLRLWLEGYILEYVNWEELDDILNEA